MVERAVPSAFEYVVIAEVCQCSALVVYYQAIEIRQLPPAWFARFMYILLNRPTMDEDADEDLLISIMIFISRLIS